MGYFNQGKNSIFHTIAFTELKSYFEYAREDEIEVLLCSEEFAMEIMQESNSRFTFLLAKNSMVRESDGIHTIFKYQSAEDIMISILNVYSPKDLFDEKMTVQGTIKSIGITSPAGGSWCSSLAVALAYFYGKKSKTLFISFDPFFAGKSLGLDIQLPGITESVCYIRQNPEADLQKLSSLIASSETFDYLTGCSHWADFTEVSEKEGEHLLFRLADTKVYEVLVIDLGGFYRSSAGFLKNCSQVYVPELTSIPGKEKMKEWQRQYRLNSDVIDPRIRYLSLPYDEIIANGGYSMSNLTQGIFGSFIENLIYNRMEGNSRYGYKF